jgi:hypothetical protein
LPRILIVKTWEVATQIFLKVCPTNKKNGCQRKKETHKTSGGSKKNNKGNSSGELILSIVNKKTVQELANEFDCDTILKPVELEVNKIKVKWASVKQLRNILQQLSISRKFYFLFN